MLTYEYTHFLLYRSCEYPYLAADEGGHVVDLIAAAVGLVPSRAADDSVAAQLSAGVVHPCPTAKGLALHP